MSERYTSNSEGETRAIAVALASRLTAGSVLLLSGDLGAGKTAFVRGLAEGLAIDPEAVSSPTFTIVHEYSGGRLPLVHVDLYRLPRADLYEIGLDPELAARGVLAVEWPERLTRPPQAAVRVTLSGDQDEREIVITGLPTDVSA